MPCRLSSSIICLKAVEMRPHFSAASTCAGVMSVLSCSGANVGVQVIPSICTAVEVIYTLAAHTGHTRNSHPGFRAASQAYVWLFNTATGDADGIRTFAAAIARALA